MNFNYFIIKVSNKTLRSFKYLLTRIKKYIRGIIRFTVRNINKITYSLLGKLNTNHQLSP